ncbi:Protein odr-4-like [Acipenser ruthenus]|uniref:Protein odr-4 homolog n=1 Tax=Acipenser ruthenus TaxID=7906 RepID=A0A662YR49_ACIRT|nr:Protein odr-4-like [Acipenser ruthenus]
MGRTYFVEDSVEQYLQHILDTSGKACVTGLLIGQCSPQRDFVLLAVRTPPKETQSDQVDEEWVVEHATQVSRMLPGGLAVLGVFLGAAPELSVQAQNILRRNGLKEWVRLIQQCSCILNGKVMGLDKDLLDGTALKRDVLNTVAIRSQMLFEDFLLNPEGYTEKGARTEEYPLPKRVFVPLAGTGVTICDYMFKDEAPKDIQFRIKELLDLDVKADQLDMLLEMDSDIVVAEPETSRLLGIVFPDDYNSMQLKVVIQAFTSYKISKRHSEEFVNKKAGKAWKYTYTTAVLQS